MYFIPFFKFYLFIYLFRLRWVFVAVHGLSLVAASGGYSSLRCVGFSLRWLLLLQSTGSRHTGFSSCGARASLFHGMWDLPGPGFEPVSPALAGGFLTTVPPGKSLHFFLWLNNIPMYVYTYHILLIHSSIGEHLGCFHFLSLMNNAAINTRAQFFVWTYVFISLGYTPRIGIAGSYGDSHV